MIEILPAQSASSRPMRGMPQCACPPSGGPGRLLYEDGQKLGVRLHWLEFEAAREVNWARELPPRTLVLCLNLEGQGTVLHPARTLEFQPRTAGFFCWTKDRFTATRQAGQAHCFATVEFSTRYLRQHLRACDGALHPQIENCIAVGAGRECPGEVRPLTHEQEASIRQLVQPPVPQGGRPLWYQGRMLEFMAEFFFERRGEDELFCDRQKRLGRDRAERVITILRRDLAAPPSLEAIGREVGCSPFYLSRTFSEVMAMTIPQYLRKLRIERAAELLRGGKHNVTEAALEVGYSSLSHFSQAFCQTMGCCPGLYPLRGHLTANK